MIKRALRTFVRHRRASVAVISALALPALIGLAGLVAEYGNGLDHKVEDQRIADAAAFAAATAYDANSSNSLTSVVGLTATLNGIAAGDIAESLVTSPSGDGNQAVEATVTTQVPLLLSEILNGGNTTLTVTATSYAEMKGSPVCVLGLNPTVNNAVEFSGSATQTLTDCAVMSDSASTQGFTGSGSASVNSNYGFFTKATAFNISSTHLTGPKTDDAAALADPFASTVGSFPPSGMPACSTGVNTTISSSGSLSPGTYGGIDVKSGATLTLQPGTYYLDPNCANPGPGHGAFTVEGGGIANGSGVTIVLTNSSTATYVSVGQVTISGSSTANLSASTSGAYKGFLFVNDSRADKSGDAYSSGGNPCGNCKEAFSGGTNVQLQGILYFPNDELDISGANSTTGGCITMIADIVNFSGGTTATDDCSHQSGLPQANPFVSLVQ